MKTILTQLIQNDTSCNKSATRYLYKSHPELWNQIVLATAFLPANALAKQRCWHIINDVYKRPICPITGEYVKWFENRYLETINLSARMNLQHLRGDFKESHSAEINQKRRAGNLKAVASGRKYRDKSTYTEEQKERQRKTFIRKYGVDNPSKDLTVRKKISDIQVANGATPVHLRDLRRIYYEKVAYFTKQSWIRYFDQINPDRISRSENALDHIYSKHQGFKDGIPPYILGHWTNLRIITVSENSKKREKCGKTQDQLFEDYFRNK